VSRTHKLIVGLTVGAVAVGLAACGGTTEGIGRGVYRPTTPPAHSTPGPAKTPTTPATTPATTPTTGTAPTTTEPTYLHPPSGQPWTVKGTANWVAAQFLEASDSVSWTWKTPAQYLVDARPYMTPSLYRLEDGYEQRAIARGGAPGDDAFWHKLVADHDGTYIQIDFAYVATEAGVTPSTEIVRVAYWLGQIVGGVTEPVDTAAAPTFVDCTMHKIGGRWYVASSQPVEAG